MTLPYLPDDCIYYILKCLQNYRSTLFSCLLVNRFWCEATVPLLYANPFDNITNDSIILTLILCFNKTEIIQLNNLLNIDIINDEYEPLFEYLKYLENFDYDKINSTTIRWINHLNLPYNLYSNKSYDNFKNFILIIHKSILRICDNIKQLDISLSSNQTFTSNLTKLNSLALRFNEKNDENESIQEFLTNIVNICLNLRKLEISSFTRKSNYYTSTNTKEKLCTIIQKQNNLKVIKLNSYCQRFLNDILLSLEFQKSSLVYVEFKDINFNNISFKNFINLYNLKYLKFDNCIAISLDKCDKCEILKYALFKLKRLEIEIVYELNDNFIPLIIKYLGALSQELLVDKLNIPIIENITTYCLDLVTLEIKVKSNIDLFIFSYFKNLRIRNLNIIDDYSNGSDNGSDWNYNYSTEVFKVLANSLPINVKEISFHSYELSYFKKFLENCHNCLEVINLSCSIELALLKMILKYIKRSSNSLKFWGVTKLEKVLNDEELKLLDKIKAKGVKIVPFCKIYEEDDSFI